MIRSYRDKETARLASGESVRRWELFRQQAVAKLETIIELGSDIPTPLQQRNFNGTNGSLPMPINCR